MYIKTSSCIKLSAAYINIHHERLCGHIYMYIIVMWIPAPSTEVRACCYSPAIRGGEGMVLSCEPCPQNKCLCREETMSMITDVLNCFLLPWHPEIHKFAVKYRFQSGCQQQEHQNIGIHTKTDKVNNNSLGGSVSEWVQKKSTEKDTGIHTNTDKVNNNLQGSSARMLYISTSFINLHINTSATTVPVRTTPLVPFQHKVATYICSLPDQNELVRMHTAVC